MSLVSLITDTHWGVHKSSDIYLKSQLKFFREQFIPYLRDNNITDIIHLGDFYDNRNHINIKVKNEVYKLLEEMTDFNIHILVGNHDAYFKNSIEINSLKFLQKFDNITLVEDIKKINIDGRDILLVPWIVDHEDFKQRVANKNIDCEVCMGHLEMKGIKLFGKVVSNEGLSVDLFHNNYKLIFSGHFHARSKQKRGDSVIQYIGNPYHLTRHDIGTERGFCIFDTDTLEYEFVENTKSLKYVKIKYPKRPTKKIIQGNIVDVEIDYNGDYDDTKVQKYLELIESYQPVIPPFPKYINKLDYSNDQLEIETQSITELIKEYVSTLEIENKDVIYNKIKELYDECKGESR